MIPGDGGADNVANQVTETQASLDSTTMCPVHSETGKCRHGFKCRFLGAHVEAAGDGISDESSLIIDGEKAAHAAVSAAELNFVDPDVRKQLRTRKVTTFYSPSRWNSVDSMCSGIARLPPHVRTVSEAGVGCLPERDPTIIIYEGRGDPRIIGGGGGLSLWRWLRGFEAINIPGCWHVPK